MVEYTIFIRGTQRDTTLLHLHQDFGFRRAGKPPKRRLSLFAWLAAMHWVGCSLKIISDWQLVPVCASAVEIFHEMPRHDEGRAYRQRSILPNGSNEEIAADNAHGE